MYANFVRPPTIRNFRLPKPNPIIPSEHDATQNPSRPLYHNGRVLFQLSVYTPFNTVDFRCRNRLAASRSDLSLVSSSIEIRSTALDSSFEKLNFQILDIFRSFLFLSRLSSLLTFDPTIEDPPRRVWRAGRICIRARCTLEREEETRYTEPYASKSVLRVPFQPTITLPPLSMLSLSPR